MTIAIYQPARGKHHMHRRSLAARLWTWLTGETIKIKPHEGATEQTPVIDAVIVTDPFDTRWRPEPGNDVAPFIGEWVEAQYHAEHGRPLDTDRQHDWATNFTGYYQAIQVAVDDEQLALPAGSAAA